MSVNGRQVGNGWRMWKTGAILWEISFVSGKWRLSLSLSLISPSLPVLTIMRAAYLFHTILPWYSASLQARRNGARLPWTTTSKTMSPQTKFSSYAIVMVGSFSHSNKKAYWNRKKLQTNILDEHRYKILNKILANCLEKHLKKIKCIMIKWVLSKDARLVQHMKFSKSNTTHKWT